MQYRLHMVQSNDSKQAHAQNSLEKILNTESHSFPQSYRIQISKEVNLGLCMKKFSSDAYAQVITVRI